MSVLEFDSLYFFYNCLLIGMSGIWGKSVGMFCFNLGGIIFFSDLFLYVLVEES